jgi:hypothetical protein
MAFKSFNVVWMLVFVFISGCTSLGHESRTSPQIALDLENKPSKVSLEGSGELMVAMELMLVSHGINVVPSSMQIDRDTKEKKIAVRYAINATSTDLDVCIPEGSRQMNFTISANDLQDNRRLFFMNGNYGCKNTIVRRFEQWFFR